MAKDMKKGIVLLSVGVLALATGAVVWAGLNLPPPLWILRYGFPGAQHPTGKTVSVEGVTFVIISRGYFRMGSDYMTEHRASWIGNCTRGDVRGRLCKGISLGWGKAPIPPGEMPVHWVQFPRGFGIARTEVTNAEYERFDPKHGAVYRQFGVAQEEESMGAQKPVTAVTWEDARKYCVWLSKKSGLNVRLPSESEWECACRAGSRTEFPFGDDSGQLGDYAWYSGNASKGLHDVGTMKPFLWSVVHEVGTKKPNVWGLFNMLGNVSEVCADRWHDSYLLRRTVKGKGGSVSTETVARAPDDGSAWDRGSAWQRVTRGGACGCHAWECRSADRDSLAATGVTSTSIGIRPAVSWP